MNLLPNQTFPFAVKKRQSDRFAKINEWINPWEINTEGKGGT